MQVPVITLDNGSAGEIDLPEALFAAEPRVDIMARVVHWQLAKRRAGTHKTKGMGEVSGTTKKPYRQKGTGNARQGSMRAHQMVGGGRAFGPKPRDYGYTLPRKVKKGALRSALSLRLGEQKLVVLDKFDVAGKTKDVIKALGALGTDSALIVDLSENQHLARGTRNLPWAKWIAPEGLNVYDVLDHDTLIVTSDSLTRIQEALRPKTKEKAEAKSADGGKA